jgi:hypothetical protein
MKKFIRTIAAFAALALIVPMPVLAQDVPSYGQASPSYAAGEETIHGRILDFSGRYDLTVRDERGFVDKIRLHQGTIINPTGVPLSSGMDVSIIGQNVGPYFAANEIDPRYVDTQYVDTQYSDPQYVDTQYVDTQYVPYPGAPYYPAYPYYGPSVDFGFFFGGDEFHDRFRHREFGERHDFGPRFGGGRFEHFGGGHFDGGRFGGDHFDGGHFGGGHFGGGRFGGHR